MSITIDIYEAHYLELALRPGFEGLRQKCYNLPCRNSARRKYYADEPHDWPLSLCKGRGWVPLLEAERLGALVEAAE